MKKLKNKINWVSIVLSDSNGGGTEYNQRNLISHLADNGENCTIIIIQNKKYGSWQFLEDKVKVIYFPFKTHFFGYLYLLPFLFIFSRKNEIEHIFTSQTLINGLVGLSKRLGLFSSSKIIVRESNSIFELLNGKKLKIYKLAYKIGYPYVDLVICQTEYMKNKLTESLPWLDKKTTVTVINNPFYQKEVKRMSKEHIEGLSNINYIVAAGRLVHAKGFDILIESFSDIHYLLKDFKLIILGEGADREKLLLQIKRLNLEDKIILQGLVPNVYPYFKNAQLCVMSSRIEGFPNTLLQMMSQNEKIVTTLSAGDIDKIPGIFTLPINDKRKLSEVILKCIKSDTSKNKKKFNDFLSSRDADSFFSKTKRLIK